MILRCWLNSVVLLAVLCVPCLVIAQDAADAHHAYFPYWKSNGKFVYIRSDGVVMSEWGEFEAALGFVNNVARVNRGGKWQLIDKKGIPQIGQSFARLSDATMGIVVGKPLDAKGFSIYDLNGNAVSGMFDDLGESGEFWPTIAPKQKITSIPFLKGEEWGLVSLKGEVLVDATHPKVNYGVAGKAPFKSSRNRKWGYLNEVGEIKIPPRYDIAYPFYGDRAIVKLSERWGVIDADGNFVVPPKWEDMHPRYSEGLLGVCVSGKWGYIDRDGGLVIECEYRGVGSFSAGRATVKRTAGKSGYIDSKGEVVIDAIYNLAGEFDVDSKMAMVRTEDVWGLIDRDGRWVWNETR